MRFPPRLAVAGALLLGMALLPGCIAPRATSTTHVTALRPLPHVGQVVVGSTVEAGARRNHAPHAESAQPYVSAERLRHGYTLVVVGVNGDNMLSAGLAPGLVAGGYPGAVEVVDWTTGHWPLFLYHLRAESRHARHAQIIADKITAYRRQYPDRPVNLVGYSAGAVVVVESIESLPPGVEIDRAVLIAGAISPWYDLRVALARSRDGIVSYYQPQDLVALWAGTTLAGTADGAHFPSAGAVGFFQLPGASDEDLHLYRDKLTQVAYRPRMALCGNLGGHFQCVSRAFVAHWISPHLAGHPGHELARADTQPRY